MTDLRKIVEVLRDNPGSFWDAEFIFPLIDAVVEERARYLYAIALAKDSGITTHQDNQDWWNHTANKEKYRTQALNELNLKDVWPTKEKTNG